MGNSTVEIRKLKEREKKKEEEELSKTAILFSNFSRSIFIFE